MTRRKQQDDLGALVPFDLSPFAEPDYSKILGALTPRPLGEAEAELFMQGLQAQARSFEAALKPNEQLLMVCWHGNEKLQVLSVGMPSNNVVALQCRNAEGNIVQVTGHMNSITFSFQIVATTVAVNRKKIGFEFIGPK